MPSLTDRFLAAFGRIEASLHVLANAEDEDNFGDIVSELYPRHLLVRKHAKDLRRFAKLRNFLSHKNQKEMAAPNEPVVRRAESLAGLFDAPPPLLMNHFSMQVDTCSSSQPVGSAARVMYDKSFSQLPVVDDGRVVGLLTSETIARWIATKLADINMLDEETVGQVQTNQEKDSQYVLVARTYSVTDAFDLFDVHLKKGNDLDAILITNSGIETETLLGIVTAADIPKMLSLIDG
jgi:predicted transcriptional regulator